MTGGRDRFLQICTLLLSLTICSIAGEFIYRRILFGNYPKFKKIRKPQLYADYDTDDYWKLYYIFGGEFKPPQSPHPLLGWIGNFDRKTLRHNESDQVNNRRPILLYGDSFAGCVTGVDCFQNILNNDPIFAKRNYLLNYGVGGYAVDQITLLIRKTYRQYPKPFIVFGIMCADLDRSVLTCRTGQKPYYEFASDSLVLRGIPVKSNPEEFFKQNPPQIISYLWRRLIFSPRNPFPERINKWLKDEKERSEEKIRLNNRILQNTIDELKNNKVDFVFLVFHFCKKDSREFSVEYEDNWRDRFLHQFIDRNKTPYIWSKGLIRKDPAYHKDNLFRYIRPQDGHPTTYFNNMIATEIKRVVLAAEN
jgi:hypothetical protein